MKLALSLAALVMCIPALQAGEAKGVFRVDEGEFKIGFAIADRDAGTGLVRILLAEKEPVVSDLALNLDRLGALGEATDYRYILVTPEEEGKSFNIATYIEGLSAGGGGLYDSEIEISDSGVKGSIHSEVLQGRLDVDFEAEYLPPRNKLEDLPAGGGDAGAVLLKQVQAAASGDREAILATLSPEQREQFEALPQEEQEEALEFTAEIAPREVKVIGGSLYDGYAILAFTAVQEGAPVTGDALLIQDGDEWRVRLVSIRFE